MARIRDNFFTRETCAWSLARMMRHSLILHHQPFIHAMAVCLTNPLAFALSDSALIPVQGNCELRIPFHAMSARELTCLRSAVLDGDVQCEVTSMSGHGSLHTFREDVRTYVQADVLLHAVRAVLDESLAFTGLQKVLVLNSIVRTIQMQANVQDAHISQAPETRFTTPTDI